MNWSFSHDEFAYLWCDVVAGDRIPYPLSIRTSARTKDEHDAHRRDLRRWFDSIDDTDICVALGILSEPSTELTAYGEYGDAEVRVLGAANGPIAAVLSQHAGELHMWLGARDLLATRVSAALPQRPAGREPARTAPLDEVRRDPADRMTSAPNTTSADTHIRQLLRRQRSGIGHLIATIRTGQSKFERVLTWIDVADDGRYLIRSDTDVEVLPASASTLQRELEHLVSKRNLNA